MITAAFLASAATSMVGARTPSPALGVAAAEGVQPDQGDLDPNGYFIDMLFRSDGAKPDPNVAAVRGEAGRIFANALRQREIPPADKSYLTQLVATRTGLTEPNADKRVSEVLLAAQQAADRARKVIAHSLLWAFLALLIGAFCASFAATIGGRQRDHVVVVND